MKELLQNNLEEATTDIGFVQTINENAGEVVVALEREVELEDGTVATVAGITPEKMRTILDNNSGLVSFKTPGENVDDLLGVCQAYNSTLAEKQVFPEIAIGESRAFKFKESYEDLDELTLDEYFAFMEENNILVIESTGNTLGTPDAMIGVCKVIDEKMIFTCYLTASMAESFGLSKSGWYEFDAESLRGDISIDNFKEVEGAGITTLTIANIVTSDEVEKYDTNNAKWLFEEVK